jgi:polyketide cyclase/dehydrase/lipid transport protein
MATIRLQESIAATPEQFVAALTDFGPGRSEIFGNSEAGYLEVHSQGPTEADVTEGSKGVWERLHYDWSDPTHIVLTTTDSNTWSNKSGHTYTLTPRGDGKTDVDVEVVRDGKNLKGKAIALLLPVLGKRVLGKTYDRTFRAIEARAAAR